jgi:hypothetical protein
VELRHALTSARTATGSSTSDLLDDGEPRRLRSRRDQLDVPSRGAHESLEIATVQGDDVVSISREQDYCRVDHV